MKRMLANDLSQHGGVEKVTNDEKTELKLLREKFQLHSLGDRPASPSVAKIRRIMELELKESGATEGIVGVVLTRDERIALFKLFEYTDNIKRLTYYCGLDEKQAKALLEKLGVK